MGGNNRTNPIKNWWKGSTKLFSVVSYASFPVESNCVIYIFVLFIVNEIIRIFDTWVEITEKNPITIWWKGLPKPFSVVSDVFFPI